MLNSLRQQNSYNIHANKNIDFIEKTVSLQINANSNISTTVYKIIRDSHESRGNKTNQYHVRIDSLPKQTEMYKPKSNHILNTSVKSYYKPQSVVMSLYTSTNK